jgi:regulator of replication initiation timing
MHGECRDLRTRLARSTRDLQEAQGRIKDMTDDYQAKIEENTTLNQEIVDLKSKISGHIEKN